LFSVCLYRLSTFYPTPLSHLQSTSLYLIRSHSIHKNSTTGSKTDMKSSPVLRLIGVLGLSATQALAQVPYTGPSTSTTVPSTTPVAAPSVTVLSSTPYVAVPSSTDAPAAAASTSVFPIVPDYTSTSTLLVSPPYPSRVLSLVFVSTLPKTHLLRTITELTSPTPTTAYLYSKQPKPTHHRCFRQLCPRHLPHDRRSHAIRRRDPRVPRGSCTHISCSPEQQWNGADKGSDVGTECEAGL
jgi:hypothetical protein